MRNPIFASTTLFTDAATGQIPQRLTGEKTISLHDGSRLVRLETNQPLVRIRTASGIMLDMSPESAFSLTKTKDGDLLRWEPVFNPSAHNLDPLSADLPENYPAFGSADETLVKLFVAGLVCGNGTHQMVQNRATSVVLPARTAHWVESRILQYVETLVEAKELHAYSMRHSAIDMADGSYFLRSRVFSYLANPYLTEKLQQPTAFLYTALNSTLRQFTFFRGLISALVEIDKKLTFYNRDADVVEWVCRTLWHDFGVPSRIMIDPMEPKIQPGRFSARPHHLVLDSDGIAYAVAAGLRDGVYLPQYLSKPVPDPIVSVTPLEGRTPSVIVTPGPKDRHYPITANGLQFNAMFAMPSGIESIAAHPMLVNDPAYF